MMASDTQLCYGNQQKFKDVTRLFSIPQSNTLIGFSGEYSDVQHIMKLIHQIEGEDFVDATTAPRSAGEIPGYLSRVLYSKRSKMNPLWNQIAIGGISKTDYKPFLGYLDQLGTTYEDNIVATGFGAYFAIPLLRQKASVDMTYAAARELLEECMKILFARDCRGYNRIQIATVTSEGVTVGEPYVIHPQWYDGG